jgi:uncharacterized protein (UPF0333 family)
VKKFIKKKGMDERGQFSYAFILVIMLLSLVFLFFFVMPLMQNWTVSWQKGLQKVTQISLDQASGINDLNTLAEYFDAINAQTNNMVTSNQILSSLIGFSGIIIVLLVTLTLYLVAKRNTEAGLIG